MSILDLFFADDGVHGVQLYSTDGSTVTALTSFPTGGVSPSPLTLVDGVAYFLAPDGNGQFGPQFQLWRSDGTAAGTFALGLSSDAPTGPPQVAQIGDTILYLGEDDTHREALFASVNGQPGQFVSQLGQSVNAAFSAPFLGVAAGELSLEIQSTVWVSDGTAAGTHLLSDGESSPSIQNASAPVTFNGHGYFTGVDANNVSQLFKLTGGSASVVPASVVGSAGFLVPLPGHLVYMGSGGELDSWDGVSSTHVKLFSSVQNNIYVGEVGGKLYFLGPDQANSNSPTGLYVTDGTLTGTHQVASGDYSRVIDLGSRLVLEENGNDGIFVSDGTVAGTTEVVSSSPTLGLTKVGDRAFFTVDGHQLWVTDGTVAGTREVVSGVSINDLSLNALGEQLVFTGAADGVNFEPWVSDGTASGTHVIANIHAPNPGNLGIADETAFGSGIAFLGTPPTTGAGIWVSDGTVAGTGEILTSFNSPAFIPGPAVAAGGKLFFLADPSTSELMVSSGKPGTTATDLGTHSAQFMTAFDNKLYFYDSSQGPAGQFFVSDGTVSGTTAVTNAVMLTQPVVLGSDMVFLGVGADSQIEVYKSDGASAGTMSSLITGAGPTTQTAASMTVSGSKAFFVAETVAAGIELWVTDGTSAGTSMVKDITAGAGDSNPSNITAFDGGVIFNVTSNGGQIWFSNGTAAGTFQLNVNQTHDPSASLQASTAIAFDGKSFFVANDGIHGDQLWASNGTAAGTSVVTTLAPNATLESAAGFVSLGSKLFFADQDNVWISDGTNAGTIELQPAASFGGLDTTAMAPTLVNSKVYFTGTIQGQAADDLFVTDGTAGGTHDLGTIAQVSDVSVAGNDLFFYSNDPTDGPGLFAYNTTAGTKTFLHAIPQSDAFVVKVGSQIEVGTPAIGPTGNNLWVTDGTAAGTTELTNLASNVALTNFTAAGANVYFSSFGGNEGFWVTNGTAAGTREIKSGISVAADSFANVGGNLFFTATDASSQTREWIYNTTTQALTEQAAGAVTSIPTNITPVGTGAFFMANDATSQNELWHTTSTGTIVELTSPTNGEFIGGPVEMAVSGSNLFFEGTTSSGGQGVFITNGSTVTLLATLGNLSDFSVVGTDLYFENNDPTNGTELWVSDGTAAGTHRLTDTERPGASVGSGFTSVGSKLFFAANDGVHGQELWMFNGQAGGASLVSDINPGAGGSNPTGLVALGSDVYFAANDGVAPPELWRSDGTASGTVVVSTSTDGADPTELTVVGSELFYFGSDSAHGAGLFVTNGAAAPTFVKAFTNITDVSVSGGKLFFQGTDASGSELWVSNGTAAGTLKLSSTGVNPGSSPSDLSPLGASFTPRQDFNDDSRSDFLMRNTAGAVVVGEWAHNQTHLSVVMGLGPEWSFEGNADFLGDGHQDYLLENSNGAVVVGEVVNGQTTLSVVSGLGKEWTFEGVGDFLGHGRAQYLIENTAGAVLVGDVVGGQASYTLVSGLGPEWKFVGTGDFLGDGRDDYLIQNTSGAVAIGEVLNGSTKYTVAIGLGSEWKFVGTGDFLGDGHDQFLIENKAGAVVAADWDGTQTHLTVLTGLGPEWKFVGDGDFLGEGHDQFLIENNAGAVVVGDWLNGQIHLTPIIGLGSEWVFH